MRILRICNLSKKSYLSKYIFNIFPNLKKSVFFKALRNKDIKLNGLRINNDKIIYNDDVLEIYINEHLLFGIPEKITYIYSDENIIAAFKPQGMLSNIEEYNDKNLNYYKNIGGVEPTLETLVKKDFRNARICHRLDRNTCGIVLFSNNDTAYNEILSGFTNGYIKKEYIAYVANHIFKKYTATLEKYIVKDSKTGFSIVYDNNVKNSQKIITKYNVIDTNSTLDYAILNIQIPTGKTHQIRAQLKQINHPIIGDSKYGKNEINKKFKIYKQMLFAYKYSFIFKDNMNLAYLNNIILKLPKEIYIKKIGEVYEK